MGTTQNIYIPLDWHFICSIYLKYSGAFFNGHLSTHAISDSLLCYISHSLNPLLSFSLSLSPAYTPLCFYLPLIYIKGNWFVWSASLNKRIWMNVVPHLGFPHNSIVKHCPGPWTTLIPDLVHLLHFQANPCCSIWACTEAGNNN